MTDLTLLRPLWLLALPVVALVGVLLVRRRGAAGDWGRVADPALMAAMQALGRVEAPGRGAVPLAALATAALVALALTGPATERRDAVSFRNLDGVVFVLDASPSMTGDAAAWSRMQAAARFAVAGLGSRPAALVVFAGDAYAASELTADHLQLGQTLALVGPDTVPDPGSRPERGLALAREVLDEGAILAGDVLLLTDGAGLGPAALAEAGGIAERGARLSVIAPDPDAPAVATLAATGAGRTFAPGDAEGIAAFLTEDARTRLERQDWAMAFRADLGRWLLVPALLPALLLLRRRTA